MPHSKEDVAKDKFAIQSKQSIHRRMQLDNRRLAGGEPNVCKCVAGPRFASIGLL